LFFVIALGTAFSAHAEERKNCYGFENSLEISSCFNEELTEYDNGLNKTYQAILKKLKHIGERDILIESLKKAQREWISYRDINCQFHSDIYLGGSAAGTEYVSCKARMTKERLKELSDELEYFNDKFN
jgi:uncharacterized protein YecT (DUF1311 family)